MRSILIVLAVALLAAPAFGQNSATMKLTTDGAAQVGDEMQIDPALVPGPFYLDIMIEGATDANLTAFQLTLTGPANIVLAPASTLFGNTLNYAGQYANYAARAGGFASLGWDMSATGSVVFPGGPLPQAGPPADIVGTIPAGTTASQGWVAWVQLDGALPGDVITATGVAIGDSDFQPMTVEVIPLRITPEPTSMLLLLAGLPLLRRRR